MSVRKPKWIDMPNRLKKSLLKKPPAMQAKLLACLTQLQEDPEHNSLHVHKVQSRKGILEARIDKKNRMTFFWDGDAIVIANHCHHDIIDARG